MKSQANHFHFSHLPINKMPIGAWVSPPLGNYQNLGNSDFINLINYQILKDSKINTIYALYEDASRNLDKVLEALDYAKQVNIGYLVRDHRFSKAKDEKEMLDIISPYYQHDAFAGILVADEPGVIDYEKLRKLQDNFKKIAPDKCFYVNLLPIYAEVNQFTNGALGGEVVIDEIDAMYYYCEYVKKLEPKFLSYDYYPLEGKYPNIKETYYEQLSIIRDVCRKKNIPFWNFVQCCSFNDNVRIPNEIEIFWQINTSLAYGVKGIQYFTYFIPLEIEPEHFKGSMIDVKGRPTPIYYYVQSANEHINAIDEILMEASHLGLLVTDDRNKLIPSQDLVDIKELSSCSGKNGLIGYFNYHQDKVLFLVNTSLNEDVESYQLNFIANYHISVIQNKEKKEITTNSLTLKLIGGEGVLIKISKKEEVKK